MLLVSLGELLLEGFGVLLLLASGERVRVEKMLRGLDEAGREVAVLAVHKGTSDI
jgi:hypothetical protein